MLSGKIKEELENSNITCYYPYFNSSGKVGIKKCTSEVGYPSDSYQSFDVYKWILISLHIFVDPACYPVLETAQPPTTTPVITTITMDDEKRTYTQSTIGHSIARHTSEMKETDFIQVIAVVCGLLLPVLSLLLIYIICKNAEQRDLENQNVANNRIEINDITPTETEETHLLLTGATNQPQNTTEYATTSGMSDVYFTPKKSMSMEDNSGTDASLFWNEEKNKTEEDESLEDVPEDDKQYMLQLSAKLSGRILELFCTIIEKETGSSLEETVQNEDVKDYLKNKYEKDPHKLDALYDTSEEQNNENVVIDRTAVPLEVWYCIIMDMINGMSDDKKERVKKLKLCRDYFQKPTQTKMEEFEEKRTEMTECVEYFDKKYGLVMCKAIKGEEEEIRRNIEMKRRGQSDGGKNKTVEDEIVEDVPEDDEQYMLQLSAKLSGRILELFPTVIEKETGSSLEETAQNEDVKDYLKNRYEKDQHKLAALYDTSEGQNNESVVIDRTAVPLEVWYCIIMDMINGMRVDEKERVKKLKLCRDYFQKTTRTKMEEFEEKRTEMTECVEYFDKKYGLAMCKAIKGEEEEIRRNIEMKRRGPSADSVSDTSEVDHPNSDEEETVNSGATDTKKDKYMKVAHVIRGAVYDVLLGIAKSETDNELTEFLCREDIEEFLGDSLEPHEMSLYTEDGNVSTEYVTSKVLFLIIRKCMKPAPLADIKELKKGRDYFDSITGSEEEEEIKEKWITLAKSIKTLDDLYQTGVYMDLCYNAKQYMPSLQ